MKKRTYRGSCHCGHVTFEADVDLSQGTGKCNCTSCWKRRWWSVRVKPEDFRPLSGTADLVPLPGDDPSAPGGFCGRCGVCVYRSLPAAEWNDGAFVSVNLASLDDLPVQELLEAPVHHMDGLGDKWWEPPAEIRHL